MIPVDSITEKELDKRFNSSPLKIQEALTSARNLTIVEQVCQNNSIADEEKKLQIQQIVALAMLGIIHCSDMGPEINEALLLNNPQFSNSVAEELNIKIFSPIKSEVESNYHPIIPALQKAGITTSASSESPSITKDGGAKASVPVPIVPKAITPKAAAPAPMPVTAKPPVPPTAPKPNLSAAGWSKLSSATIAPAPMPTAPAAKTVLPMAPKMAMPKPVTGPAPVIMHEDAIFKVQPAKPDFHISIHPEDLEVQKSANVVPLKPAMLELGKRSSVPMPPPNRVMHYDEFKEKLLANIPVPTAKGVPQRQITEITATPMSAPAPKPPVPPVASQASIASPVPKPAPAPKPSIAPTKMAEEIKVVQKDYL